MRSRQAPLILTVNVSCPEIEHSFSGSRHSAAGDPEQEANMCITATNRRGDRGSSSQVPAKAQQGQSLEVEQQQESSKDKLMLPQPHFLLERKDRPFKRHASDLVLKSESGLLIYPEKRARSSSFTFYPSCSPAQTDGITGKRTRSSSFTLLSAFPPSSSGTLHLWNVLKPATLQPPQSPHCGDVKRAECGTECMKVQPDDKKLSSKENCSNVGGETTTSRSPNGPTRVTEVKARSQPFEHGSRLSRPTSDFVFGENMDKRVTLPSSKERCNVSSDHTSSARSGCGPMCVLDTKARSQPFEQFSRLSKTTCDFVFGENMDKRVTRPQEPTPSLTTTFQCKWEGAALRAPGLRSSPYQRPGVNTSLLESAAAYTNKPRQKYELDQVEVITGEESERNVLQVNCKLFVLDSITQMWTERGRGYLRLNDIVSGDKGMFRSRIVMRNFGSLKLLFNSKIFDQMKLERANRRSLRITATDLMDNSLKVFLIQASVKDAGRLYAAIHHRLVALRNCRDNERKVPRSKSETDKLHHRISESEDDNDEEDEDEEEDEMTMFHRNITDHHQWIRRQPALYS
uniref:RAN binding protein 3 like n=1 Tax=Leptobrachium leishanense TaxID=445787 RepID=A0A8C5LHB8_9ANUR